MSQSTGLSNLPLYDTLLSSEGIYLSSLKTFSSPLIKSPDSFLDKGIIMILSVRPFASSDADMLISRLPSQSPDT